MVSQIFVDNLYKHIQKQLKDVLAGTPMIQPLGSTEDKYKGLGDSLKTAVIPFRKSTYQAEEYLHVRIPVRGQHFSFIDFATPILNVKEKSVQGIASYATSIPYPIPETYVQRMVGLKYRMLPHKLIVDQKMKPKKVLKGNMIKSNSVNSINADKKLCNKLQGSWECKVHKGLSKAYYKIEMDFLEYPPGMFTMVPYHGNTILMAKEAGEYGARVNVPKYSFKDRYEAFLGVARNIASTPQTGEQVGKFYMDQTLDIILPPLLESLKGQSGQATSQQ